MISPLKVKAIQRFYNREFTFFYSAVGAALIHMPIREAGLARANAGAAA